MYVVRTPPRTLNPFVDLALKVSIHPEVIHAEYFKGTLVTEYSVVLEEFVGHESGHSCKTLRNSTFCVEKLIDLWQTRLKLVDFGRLY